MTNYKIIQILFIAISFMSCRSEDILSDVDETTNDTGISIDVPDWTEATHGIQISPNYDVVFNQNEVLRIDLVIGEDEWETMQNDLDANLGSSSSGPGGRPGGGTTLVEFDPVWVPCSVFHDGTEWYKVGVRYKGNSSLSSAYSSGNGKLSFKLDFDQFESDYPAITDQRFYGFKQLSLKNNYLDASLIREKVASDLFRNFGLASSQTSFCAVYVDFGSGAKYFGLYTLVEEVDDTVLGSQFADGTGNCYKPDGDAASFASGTYDESEMEKQTNVDLADYSDVKALYDAINNSTRTSDLDAWKTTLESSLDVDVFLKWLAANTTIQNWDTYGNMTHNYYLYNNPTSGLLEWIPWDANEAFEAGKLSGALSLELSTVSSSWPLISYLIDVPEYEEKYQTYLQQFIDEEFAPSKMQALYDSYYLLLKDYAYAEEKGYTFLSSDASFDSAIETLKSHVSQRNTAVLSYLK
ncbi:MAG: CotH kinase family protein [Prolixibacteraceae bacterium]